MRRSRRGRRPPPGEAGLTLIEVLVAVLLLGLVVGGLLPLLTAGTQGSTAVSRRQAMIQNARVALDKLVREMRAAESLRIVSPGLLIFTLFWGDGTGARPTVEYSLDNATRTLDYAWIADYDYRTPITVQAQDGVGAGYAVALTFNHAALVTARKSQPGGDDVRVLYWTGSAWVELDRVLDPTSAWNTAATRIWFRLQAPIAANALDGNYYLYYGNLADGAPPARGDNVFLDYQDGTTIDGWTRRDSLGGTPYSSSATGGFVFQETSNSGLHELTKNVAHTDVDIFWGFWNNTTDNTRGNQAGVGARFSDTGAGYLLVPGDSNNNRFRIYYTTSWGSRGSVIGSLNAGVTTGQSYYGRLYLVGSSIQGKYWQVGTPEPPWQLSVTDSSVSGGNHYGQIDGTNVTMDHRHRTMIVRPRVPLEPVVTLGAETAGARPDPLQPLAGSFRSLGVACFDGSGALIVCSPVTSVRQVQVSLVAMDPTGAIPDVTVTEQVAVRTP